MPPSAAIQPTTLIARDDEIIAEELNGETVMMSLETSKYYGLGSVGSRIWALFKQPTTVIDVCTALQREYNIDADTCQHEVLVLVQRWADEGLVRVVEK